MFSIHLGLVRLSLVAALELATRPAVMMIVLVLVVAAAGAVRLRCSPRPLAGIVPKRTLLGTLFGDLPDLVSIILAKGSVQEWIVNQTTLHRSELVCFSPAGILASPSVVLVNHAEAQDVIRRRGADFDVASLHNDIFRGFMPGAAVTQYTDDRHKSIRALTRHVMTPSFLSEVSGPRIYDAVRRFTDAWKVKARRAGGRPWNAASDLDRLSMNVGFSVVFGARQLDRPDDISSSWGDEPLGASKPSSPDEPIEFEQTPLPALFQASRLHNRALVNASLGAPRLYYFVVGFLASWKASLATMYAFMGKRAAAFSQELSRDAGTPPETFFEAMISRDISQLQGARLRTVQDEAYSHVLGNNDTIPHVMSWALVYLGVHQDLQRELRASLRAAHHRAAAEERDPSLEQILGAPCPLLDAFIQEVLRSRPPLSFLLKQAMRDTTILGHAVPKGTQVFIPTCGPGLTEPAINATQATTPGWEKPEAFDPHRWLCEDLETGGVTFDPKSGPFLTFGAGRRSCFGKPLAYLNLRVMLTLLVWSFEFDQLPDEIEARLGLDKHKSERPRATWVRLRQVR